MVDIHCHVLPGLDDGSPDLETSIEMCKHAVEDGITHVVGTPHCSDEYEFSFEANTAKRDELQAAIGKKPERPAVRGPEGRNRPVGARQLVRRERVERAHPQTGAARRGVCEEGDPRSVGRDGQGPRR